MSENRAQSLNVNIVCALQAEARPIIEHLKLSKQSNPTPFDVFTGSFEGGTINLLLSGVGVLNMASATAWLAGLQSSEQNRNSVWVNVGVAGHKDLELATAVRVARCTSFLSSRSYCPALIAPWSGPVGECYTAAKATIDYPEAKLLDMEAYAFLNSALKYSFSELVQIIKIVSDNSENHLDRLNGETISGLVRENLVSITQFLRGLTSLTNHVPIAGESVETLEAVSLHLRLSKSRRLQLQDSYNKLIVLGVGQEQLLNKIKSSQKGGELINDLKDLLRQRAPVIGLE